jgi:hypothetical protein
MQIKYTSCNKTILVAKKEVPLKDGSCCGGKDVDVEYVRIDETCLTGTCLTA